jgi:formylglycine-generating enzyme required for sulfatase activity
MPRPIFAPCLWASLWLLAYACTSLKPVTVHDPEHDGGPSSQEPDAGSGRSDGGNAGASGDVGDSGTAGHGGSGRGGNGTAQGGPDAGAQDGGGTGGTSGGGSGDDEPDAAVDDAGPLPTGRCVGDGEMIHIDEGSFLRGDELFARSSPTGLKFVDDFRIDTTEVTVVAYADCVDDGACAPPDSVAGYCNWGDMEHRLCHPINCVTWQQATTYCEWVGKRLPNETEWEFAARGPDPMPRTYPWAGSDGPADGEYAQWNVLDGTIEVGSFPLGATPEGVLDLAGNVWEWTSDTWCDSYDAEPNCDATLHVDRGGGWETLEEQFMKSAFRESDYAAGPDQFGFRCAK